MYRVALAAGVGTLIVLLGAGLWLSLRGQGRLPPLALDYGVYVQAALREGRHAEAIEQLQLAAAIDLDSRGRVLPVLAALARRLGDREAERAALVRLTGLAATKTTAHARLAEMALADAGGAEADADSLAEATRHVEQALAADPDSISALIVMGEIARAKGDPNGAFEVWYRARTLDSVATDRMLGRMFRKDPELGYDFLVYRLNQEGT